MTTVTRPWTLLELPDDVRDHMLREYDYTPGWSWTPMTTMDILRAGLALHQLHGVIHDPLAVDRRNQGIDPMDERAFKWHPTGALMRVSGIEDMDELMASEPYRLLSAVVVWDWTAWGDSWSSATLSAVERAYTEALRRVEKAVRA